MNVNLPNSLLTTVCLAALVLAYLPVFGAQPAPRKKPNVIVIYTDDHGYPDLGVTNVFSDLKTPNIDQLAKDGVRMVDGYCTAPQCSPSRVGLISGRYQNRFGLEDNKTQKVKDFVDRLYQFDTLPKRLKKAGYVTGMAGKSHLGSNDSGELNRGLGFDKVFVKRNGSPGHWNMDLSGRDLEPQAQEDSGYHLEVTTTFACSFIERFKDQPFFFYLAYRAPHVPLDPPKSYLDRFPGEMPQRRRKALAMLSAVDDGVGRIMQTLRDHDLEEDTLIFIISDNGAPLMMHKADTPGGGPGWDGSLNDPLNGEKGMLTEGGIRVPFVVYWKGAIPGGQVYSQPVITLDVAATANALAGLPDAPELDGVNLIPYLTGKKEGAPHETLYWRWLGQSAIRQGKWKYLRADEREYLFDLETDFEETTNLIRTHPEKAEQLLAKLEEWAGTLLPPGIRAFEGVRDDYFNWYLDGRRDLVKPPAADAQPRKRRGRKNNRQTNSS